MNRTIKFLLIKIFISRRLSELEELDRLCLEERPLKYYQNWRHFLFNLKSNQHLFLSVLPAFEAKYRQHVIEIEESIDQQNDEQLHQYSQNLAALLNDAYSSVSLTRSNTIRRLGFFLPLVLILALCVIAFKPLQEKYTSELARADLLKNEETYAARTVSDLLNLNKALQHYFAEKGAYPNTSGTWYGVVSPFGEAKTDWIPGLSPKYIQALPHDPRKYRQPVEQYMYQSNGKDFKLIAHFPVGMDTAIHRHPELVDPRRPSWALGVWSEGAKTW